MRTGFDSRRDPSFCLRSRDGEQHGTLYTRFETPVSGRQKLAAEAGPFFWSTLSTLFSLLALATTAAADVEAQDMTTQYHQASGALQDPSLKGGGMQWQLHNDTLQHHQQSFEDKNQYDQGSFLHQQRSQSASPPRSAPGKHGWNVRKV